MKNNTLGYIRPWLLLVIMALLLTACGRKELPQLAASNTPPAIKQLNIDHSENVMRLSFYLNGGVGGIGYQLDRAELDPYCKCPDMWQRYFEQQPHSLNQGKEITKVIRMEAAKHRFLYRLRAVDSEGHLGAWSKTIHAKAMADHE